MALSMEAHHLIARHVGNRSDLCSLSRVSKAFRSAAERALYNTLHLSGFQATISLCELLIKQPRLSSRVEALTIVSMDEEHEGEIIPPSDTYWYSIAGALRTTTRLSHLSIHLDDTTSTGSWILNDCSFQLRTFYCDFKWDPALASFLNKQVELRDLYIADFPSAYHSAFPDNPPNTLPPNPAIQSDAGSAIIRCDSLPKLSVLECPSVEAIEVLVPGRPITRVKTCLPAPDIGSKREELFSQLRLSTEFIVSLDFGDSAYTPDSSLHSLRQCTMSPRTMTELRYLGSLALPVDGQERLQFYGLLRKFARLQCVELEVGDWKPPPMTFAALRALTNELRLYCPSVLRVIFVYESDQVVITVQNNGSGRCTLEEDSQIDLIWRES